MRITVEIDDALYDEAQSVVQATSANALIEAGLRALVARGARQRAIAAAGTQPEIEAPRRRKLTTSEE